MLMPVTPVEGAEEYGEVGCKWLRLPFCCMLAADRFEISWDQFFWMLLSR